MKVSIITVCFNSIKTIEATILSVLTQKEVELEYIIVDGMSSDGTVELIKKYYERYPNIIRLISEKDSGIYDAMNKGITNSTGDIVGIINSDDCYANDIVLKKVLNELNNDKIDGVYGDLVYLKRNKPYRYWRAGKSRSFYLGWMPPHPSLFIRREIYTKYGLFRLDCGVNADYELMLRLIEVKNISMTWINTVFVYMSMGGVSNNGITSRLSAFSNDTLAWKVNNLRPFLFTILFKKIRKVPQFFFALTLSKR